MIDPHIPLYLPSATVSVDCPYLCHGSVDSTPAELRFLWPSSSFFCLCGSSSKQQLALPGFVCSAYCCPLHRVLYLYGSCAVSQNSIKLVLLISIVVSVISWEMEEFKLESFQSQAWIRIINKCNSFAFGVQTNFDLWVFALFDSLKWWPPTSEKDTAIFLDDIVPAGAVCGVVFSVVKSQPIHGVRETKVSG